MKRSRLVALLGVLLVSALFALFGSREALAVDRNFAGSAQIDYHLVPTVHEANARPIAFDGFTLEAGMKLSVDFSDHLSANIKICYGCHGFETDLAHFDYRVGDELNFRFGRFSPSFGAFNIRHDPANHRLSDKPLPYDMGRMLRRSAWNNGVLPSPFPDNGLEINGRLAFGEAGWVDYAAYAVSGFKADRTAADLDFVASRDGSLYYADNNSRPAVGGRLAATLVLGTSSDATLGTSLMHGTFDPDNTLAYSIFGADLSLRVARTSVRLEYLVRRQDFDTSDPTRFKYQIPSRGDFFSKHGAYAEVEQQLSPVVAVVLRGDGMVRRGNVLLLGPGTPPPADGELSRQSSILRYTLGSTFTVERGFMVKTSAELWQFSDKDATGHLLETSFHLAGVGTF